MKFPALAIRTYTMQQPVSAGFSTAAGAIVTTGAQQQLPPAIPAKLLIRLANAFTAVTAHRRPEKLMHTLPAETHHVFDRQTKPFWL
jgi:hypothetical protein